MAVTPAAGVTPEAARAEVERALAAAFAPENLGYADYGARVSLPSAVPGVDRLVYARGDAREGPHGYFVDLPSPEIPTLEGVDFTP